MQRCLEFVPEGLEHWYLDDGLQTTVMPKELGLAYKQGLLFDFAYRRQEG